MNILKFKITSNFIYVQKMTFLCVNIIYIENPISEHQSPEMSKEDINFLSVYIPISNLSLNILIRSQWFIYFLFDQRGVRSIDLSVSIIIWGIYSITTLFNYVEYLTSGVGCGAL